MTARGPGAGVGPRHLRCRRAGARCRPPTAARPGPMGAGSLRALRGVVPSSTASRGCCCRRCARPLRGRTVHGDDARKAATAESFGYEWSRLRRCARGVGEELPRIPRPARTRVLPGQARARRRVAERAPRPQAARFGAEVVAVDLGPAVEVARRNTSAFDSVQVIQSDLYQLPFAPESSTSSIRSASSTTSPTPRAFRNLRGYLKPGGEIRFTCREAGRAAIQGCVAVGLSAARQVTTRIPHRLLHRCRTRRPGRAAFAGFSGRTALRRLPGREGWRRRSRCAIFRLPVPGLRQRPVRPVLGADREPVPQGRGRGLARPRRPRGRPSLPQLRLGRLGPEAGRPGGARPRTRKWTRTPEADEHPRPLARPVRHGPGARFRFEQWARYLGEDGFRFTFVRSRTRCCTRSSTLRAIT